MTPCVIAYDIGGSKIRAGLIASSGDILDQSEASSRAREGPHGIVSAAHGLTRKLLGRNRQHIDHVPAVGVSTGGVVQTQQGVITAAADFMPGWKGFAIRKAFESMSCQRVLIDNDGNCALYAEVWKQSLADRDAVLLALGTGLGGAIYSNASLRTGAFFLAGHFGQTLVGDLSRPEEWERLETTLSGDGLAKLARRLQGERASDGDSDDENYVSTSFADGHAVIAALSAGGVAGDVAKAAVSRWVGLLARTCHNLQWNYDPATIIIGGGMIEAKAAWWPQFCQSLEAVNQRFDSPANMDVRPAALGNDAAMVGAGLMAWHEVGPQNGNHGGA